MSNGIHPSLRKNHFQVLSVSTVCTDEEVRKAYLMLAKEWHPDINKAPEAAERFKAVSEAYEALKDEVKRSHYRAELQSVIAERYERSPFQSSYSHYRTEGGQGYWSRFRGTFRFGGGVRRAGAGLLLFGAPLFGIAAVLGLIMNQNSPKLVKDSEEKIDAWYNSK